jgi:hypothetical protein
MDGRNVTPRDLDWDSFAGQRFRLYRVCPGETTPELVMTCGTPEALGLALVTGGREGQWTDCAIGVLDVMGEKGERWILKPWRAMPKEVSHAASVLARSKTASRQT